MLDCVLPAVTCKSHPSAFAHRLCWRSFTSTHAEEWRKRLTALAVSPQLASRTFRGQHLVCLAYKYQGRASWCGTEVATCQEDTLDKRGINLLAKLPRQRHFADIAQTQARVLSRRSAALGSAPPLHLCHCTSASNHRRRLPRLIEPGQLHRRAVPLQTSFWCAVWQIEIVGG